MGEIKSVKVDNWGVFFLQKLQNFFNKTDYCDLTLQFRDNSQLKVHRLVLSACTDFFNVLEQTCELIDDALVMPMELQADVVVPIVNFMYTGTLEFELKMYSKLLKTAKEMNMTVLLKLLEAHKRTMESSKPILQRPTSPKNRRRPVANSPNLTKFITTSSTGSTAQQSQRRMLTGGQNQSPNRRIITGKPMPGSNVFRQVGNSAIKPAPKMQRGPTRYETVDSNMNASVFESSFDTISYESKPLKEEPDDYEEMHSSPSKSRSSPFEQLRKGYNNNKRPAVSTFTSPPAKKPNIEDVKEFAEQQRMRKQIAAEYGDDTEYDGILDDEFHNDDDDDEPSGGGPSSSSATKQQQKQHQNQGQASIIIKQSNTDKPTILVKDTSNSKMDHAKIISEVLRQYPHLVKGNKNIKLKIMPNVSGPTQKVTVKKEPNEGSASESEPEHIQQARQQLMQISQNKQILLKQTGTKPIATTSQSSSSRVQGQTTHVAGTNAAGASATQPKRRIDSRTMHALIALGAENQTGPWLCLRCGVNGRPISIPSYRGFRRHLIHTHKEVIDPALCEHCGWRSDDERSLNYHLLMEHNLSSLLYTFPKCNYCAKYCRDENDLSTHIRLKHPDKQQCIYCNKTFPTEIQLYNHMKAFHKTLAREDGVVDFSDDELADFDEEIRQSGMASEKKIKILSDISLPTTILKLDELPAAIDEEYVSDNGPKFVNADGNEMVLTAEQREEIMSQLEQDHEGGVVMVLNESAFPEGEGEVEDDAEAEGGEVITGEEVKIESESENMEQYDDHQIYNEFTSQEEAIRHAAAASAREEEEKAHDEQEAEHDEQMEVDHMEWAENVISTHDPDEEEAEYNADEDNVSETTKKADPNLDSSKEDEEKVSSSKPQDSEKVQSSEPKKDDEISLKLKMLTGDWSDDEIEDEEDAPTEKNTEKVKFTEEEPSTSAKPETSDKLTSEIYDKKEPSPAKDDLQPATDHGDEENEKHDANAAADCTVKEQLPQSDDNILKKKKEFLDENVVQAALDEDPDKSEESISETLSAIEAEIRGNSPTPEHEQKSTSRQSPAKESASESTQKPDKSPTSAIEDDNNVSSSKKTGDEIADDEGKATDDKSESSADKDETVTSTKSSVVDCLKSLDKVKSLISEWVEDDDEL